MTGTPSGTGAGTGPHRPLLNTRPERNTTELKGRARWSQNRKHRPSAAAGSAAPGRRPRLPAPSPRGRAIRSAVEAGDIDFEAVAHVLANTCRWNGRTRRFLSVAQHGLIVSEEIEDARRHPGRGAPRARAVCPAGRCRDRLARRRGRRRYGLGQGGGPGTGPWGTGRPGGSRGRGAGGGAPGRAGRAAALRRAHGRCCGEARSRGRRRRLPLPAVGTHGQAARARGGGGALAGTVPHAGRTLHPRRRRPHASAAAAAGGVAAGGVASGEPEKGQ